MRDAGEKGYNNHGLAASQQYAKITHFQKFISLGPYAITDSSSSLLFRQV